VALFLLGCDAWVGIQGRVISDQGEPLDRCTATLFRAESGQEVEVIDIDSSFDDSFSTLPARTDFFVEVSCKGYSTYRSPPFYSSGELGDPPAQLGEIVLEPLPAGGGDPAPQRSAP
jgi:hypothetical protein